MPALRCPHCGLVNPGSAMTCDCGFSFRNGQVGVSYLTPRQQLHRTGGLDTPGNRLGLRIIRIVIMGIVIGAMRHWLRL